MLNDLVLRIFAAVQAAAAHGRDEDGQTLAEYSLIVSLVGVAAVVTGLIIFRNLVAGAFQAAITCLNGSC